LTNSALMRATTGRYPTVNDDEFAAELVLLFKPALSQESRAGIAGFSLRAASGSGSSGAGGRQAGGGDSDDLGQPTPDPGRRAAQQ
jgi:hypothetical protein